MKIIEKVAGDGLFFLKKIVHWRIRQKAKTS